MKISSAGRSYMRNVHAAEAVPSLMTDVPPLMLDGLPIYVSGVAGHFVGSSGCRLRMCWRVGMLRVSTVGGYEPDGPDGPFEQVGPGRWSETMVFRVIDREREPEGVVTESSGVVTTTWVDGQNTRDAERLHILIATELAKVTDGPTDELRGSEIDLAIERAHARMDERCTTAPQWIPATEDLTSLAGRIVRIRSLDAPLDDEEQGVLSIPSGACVNGLDPSKYIAVGDAWFARCNFHVCAVKP